MFLVLLAGLSSVNPELYEAARSMAPVGGRPCGSHLCRGCARSSPWQSSFARSMRSRSSTLSTCLPRADRGPPPKSISWYIYQLGFKFFSSGVRLGGFVCRGHFMTIIATLYVARFVRGSGRVSAASGHAGTLAARPAQRVVATRRDRSRLALTVLRYAVLLIVLIFCLFPILWVIGTSVKLPGEYLRNPPVWIPQNPTLAHYGNVMAQRGNLALKNSVIIACGATLLSMFVGSLAAYSLARLQHGWTSFRVLVAVATVDATGCARGAVLPVTARPGKDQSRAWSRFARGAHCALHRLQSPVRHLDDALVLRCGACGNRGERSGRRDDATWRSARITLPLAVPGLIATDHVRFHLQLDGVPFRGCSHPDQGGDPSGRHRRVLRRPGL